MRKPIATALPVAIAAALLPAAAVAQEAPADHAAPVRLSNEWSFTRVASPEALVKVRKEPDPSSRQGPRLRATTEHGAPELYLALTEATGTDGQRWVRIRIPRRPNGQTGWVRRSALGPYRLRDTALVVDRRSLKVTLLRKGKVAMRFPVGVGARRTPTPAGRFWIREKLRYPKDPLYGNRALGTSAYAPKLENWPLGGVIGLHGTGQPELIPGRPSHGCIRVRNADMAKLYRAVPVGTPVWIR